MVNIEIVGVKKVKTNSKVFPIQPVNTGVLPTACSSLSESICFNFFYFILKVFRHLIRQKLHGPETEKTRTYLLFHSFGYFQKSPVSLRRKYTVQWKTAYYLTYRLDIITSFFKKLPLFFDAGDWDTSSENVLFD